MKKRLVFFVLLVLLLPLSGCSPGNSQPAATTTSIITTATIPHGSVATGMVLGMCNSILTAEKNKDEKTFMSLIPPASPDYAYLLSTSGERKRMNYQINSFDCKLTYLQGDTARVNVTYNFAIDGNPDTKSVIWTMKYTDNGWVYEHGSR